MAEAWAYIDSKNVQVPLSVHQAITLGWYLGAEYNDVVYWHDSRYEEIVQWCKATFDPNTFVYFARSVWFLREEDAILCRLKWS